MLLKAYYLTYDALKTLRDWELKPQTDERLSSLDSTLTIRKPLDPQSESINTPLDVQQKLLRHADIRTTMGYGEVPMDNKRSANSQVVRAILVRKSAD